MAYATASDVHQLNTNRVFTATSRPSASEVGRFLDLTAAEIDAIVRQRGYTLPVPTSATSALVLLAHYNALGAAWLVESGAQKSDRLDSAASAWREAKRMLESVQLELDIATEDSKLPRYGSSASSVFVWQPTDTLGAPIVDN